MKRFLVFLGTFAAAVALFATPAFAFGWDTVTGWFGGALWTAVAAILTFIIGSVAVIHKYTDWVANLLIAVGTFFLNGGLALKDGKVTGDELKQTIADVKIIGETAMAFKTAGAANG